MNNALKIFIGVVVFLGILSGVFLLTAKKRPQTNVNTKLSQTIKQPAPSNVAPPKTSTPAQVPTPPANPQERKTLIRSQWSQCKDKTLPAGTILTWNVKITEGLSADGTTFAKGNLDNDPAFPVNVTVKPESQNIEKIKPVLVAGKTAFLQASCVGIATDGSALIQAF
jgi:hypothetical protein